MENNHPDWSPGVVNAKGHPLRAPLRNKPTPVIMNLQPLVSTSPRLSALSVASRLRGTRNKHKTNQKHLPRTQTIFRRSFEAGRCACFQVDFRRVLVNGRHSLSEASFSCCVDVQGDSGINILALRHGHCFSLLLITRHSLKAEITVTFAGKQDSRGR